MWGGVWKQLPVTNDEKWLWASKSETARWWLACEELKKELLCDTHNKTLKATYKPNNWKMDKTAKQVRLKTLVKWVQTANVVSLEGHNASLFDNQASLVELRMPYTNITLIKWRTIYICCLVLYARPFWSLELLWTDATHLHLKSQKNTTTRNYSTSKV